MNARTLLLLALIWPLMAQAGGGKLLLTGGVSSIDGAAGGGLTPWALTGGYAAEGEWGATAFVSRARTSDYGLTVTGAALVWSDRLEVSIARQDFNAADNLAPLGLRGLHLKQTIVGAKLRIAGEAVLDADTLMPQVALGVQAKRVDTGALNPTLTGALGAKRDGLDLYASATKLFLAPGVLVNGTLRLTKANQNGLLGFGGAQGSGYRLMPEVSVAWLASRQVAIGAEYRAKPDHLNRSVLGTGALKEDDWWDVFVAWAPSKTVSLTVAWVDLGRIAPAVQPRRQHGAYLSLQLAY
ncbi:DUF3034 family protein [Roseateles paludis]|jgi:hypothetical protein|uniref:DUF3034 family protein n=1 Tax=Roseateles paludis TaxID=3145238 RepID=A0ABV0G319_9BURK